MDFIKMRLLQSRLSIFWILLLTILITLNSCRKGKNIPDVSHIEVEAPIQRFDLAMFGMDTSQMETALAQLRNDYPFTDMFLDYALAYRKVPPQLRDSVTTERVINGFINAPHVRTLYQNVQRTYSNLDDLEAEVKQGMQFFAHYFPDREIPKIYSMISEYWTAVVVPPTHENAVLVSLDMFLGADHADYPIVGIPQYISRTLNREHLTTYIFKGVVDDLAGEVPGDQLLDYMIHNGKKLYVLSQLLPYQPDSILMGYTSAQMQWVQDNEAQMWTHFLEDEILYDNNMDKFRKLVFPSPSSPGMPKESPGRTGNWTGWQIVKSFMKQHPEMTLSDLLSKQDAQYIVTQSKYRP